MVVCQDQETLPGLQSPKCAVQKIPHLVSDNSFEDSLSRHFNILRSEILQEHSSLQEENERSFRIEILELRAQVKQLSCQSGGPSAPSAPREGSTGALNDDPNGGDNSKEASGFPVSAETADIKNKSPSRLAKIGEIIDKAKAKTDTAVLIPKLALTSQQIVDRYVDPAIGLVIFVNAIIIGFAVSHNREWVGWLVLDTIFVALYTLELIIKLSLFGCRKYWCGDPSTLTRGLHFDHIHLAWNIFDNVILLVSFVEVCTGIGARIEGTTKRGAPFVVLRVLRAVRFARILRVLRFDVFKELLAMLAGLVSGMRTLFWAVILLLFPIYILAIVLLTFLGEADVDSDPNYLIVTECFGTLEMAMFTVFRCTIGDCSFSNGTPIILWIASWYGFVYALGYISVIMLVTFGIFNLIMATFVDNALLVAKKNEHHRLQRRLLDDVRTSDKTVQLVRKLWEVQHREPDCEGFQKSGCSLEVFSKWIEEPAVQHLFDDLDVPEEDRLGLFEVLDADGGGTLELEELISGIMKLRGQPRRSDVIHVGLVTRSVQDELKKFKAETQTRLAETQTRLAELKEKAEAEDLARI